MRESQTSSDVQLEEEEEEEEKEEEKKKAFTHQLAKHRSVRVERGHAVAIVQEVVFGHRRKRTRTFLG